MTPRVLPPQVALDCAPLDAPWNDGHDPDEPPLQVRRIDDDTWVLRQSLRRTAEAPFCYLVRGARRALLIDTGHVPDARRMPLAATVDALIGDLPLVVAHTHGHRDHVAGDGQFAGRPHVTIVGIPAADVAAYFGLDGEGHDTHTSGVPFDLGGRELRVMRAPGHDTRSIVVADPTRGLVYTGDTAYPGRLYVDDLPALRRSIAAMHDLALEVGAHTLLGGHIERRMDGTEFPLGVRVHRGEAPLPLPASDLARLADVVSRAPQGRGVVDGRPMSLYVNNPPVALLGLAARGWAHRLRDRGQQPNSRHSR